MKTVCKKAIIFGVHSFVDNQVKVGIQYIAEGLAGLGWQIDYISIFSSPFDLYGPQRHTRLRRVWINRQDKNGIKIKPGITEYAFRSLFPAHKTILRYSWQIGTYSKLAPLWLNTKNYDVCINDISANIVYLPLFNTRFNILRLNDLPEGFQYRLSKKIINIYKHYIRSKKYDEIWSAHEPLTRYVFNLNPANRVLTIPNGVDNKYLSLPKEVSRMPKTAVFIGSVERWVDLNLLEKTAFLMPDWQFDVIGPLKQSWSVRACNLKWKPPVTREKVPELLARYQVGLIPFKEIEGRLEYVEKPLKFFEYIGAGLGVASTDVGAIRSGMGDWASYGNTPQAFASAINCAADEANNRSFEDRRGLIRVHSWGNVMRKIKHQLEKLMVS